MVKDPVLCMLINNSSTLDHASFGVESKDYEKNLQFYDETFKILGIERVMTIDMEQVKTAAYGKYKKPSFWISSTGKTEEKVGNARDMHFAFVAPSVEAVQAWHKKCLELGGKDNGAPGPRPQYHPGYYGAFIIDPNGWRIEECLHHYRG